MSLCLPGAVWGDGLSGGYLPAGPDFSSSGVVVASLPFSQAGWGCFLLHWKKRWMFLTVAGYQNYAVLSGLSAERRRQGRRCEKFSRVGRILVFRDS